MTTRALARKCRLAMSRSAYARLAARTALAQLGTVARVPGPSWAALVGSVLGLLTAPAAVIADVALLAAPLVYVVSLAGAGVALPVTILVPVALALVDVCVSLRRARERYEPDALDDHPRQVPWRLIITGILAAQLCAGGAQYLAIESSNPSPANQLVLAFLCLLAVITHAATILLSGESILLLATVAQQHHRQRQHDRLSAQVRRYTRDLIGHYQTFTELTEQLRREEPDASLELDPMVVAEFNDAIGQQPPSVVTPEPGVPPNPYAQADWNDDQRL